MSLLKKNEYSLIFYTVIFLILLIVIFLPLNSMAFVSGEQLPDAIIELPKNENAILIEKKSQTLFLYKFKSENLFIGFQAPCSTGEIEGVKFQAGDKKTPEGIYFLNAEYEDKYLSPIYGKKAFPTDYPNFIDKKFKKNGSAIWIHGTNKKLKPMDSNGCIALENDNILELSKYINLNSTPVIMLDTIHMVDKHKLKKQKKDINNMILKWAQSIETGTYQDYLSFYSPKYLSSIAWWTDWYDLRLEKNKSKSDYVFKVKTERIGLYYHNHIFVALFDFYLKRGKSKILLGKKKLFLEYQNNQYKIIGDVFQQTPVKFQKEKTPLISGAKEFIFSDEKDVILKIIHQWLEAWSAKNMKKYASFYANHFYSDGFTKTRWISRKQRLANKYDFIYVSGQAFEIKFNKQTCEVVFLQKYKSSGFTAAGIKKLRLVNKGGLWKIYQETWKKK